MRRFSKVLMSLAAVSAVSAAMAVSSMAMTATYDAETGLVALADVTETGTSQTMLVVAGDTTTTADDTNIKQIDQKDDGTVFASIVVGSLEDGTYTVRIGGDGYIQTATFTVGNSGEETENIIVGDVTGDKGVDDLDGTYMLRSYSGVTDTAKIGAAGTSRTLPSGSTLTDSEGSPMSTIIVGDANYDVSVDDLDATYALRYYAGVTDTTKIGHIGDSVEVVK